MYVCMYVCIYVCISTDCTIQSYARVCIRYACTTIVQFSGQNVPPGTITAPDYCLACGGPYLMEEQLQAFQVLAGQPRSLHIVYDFSNALKIHLNVCRVCCPLNVQIQ